MPINYRPVEFQPAPSGGGDLGGPASGTKELSHAGLTAGFEAQLSPSDVRGAHQFFQPTPTGAEAALTPMPGADAAGLAAAAPTPGAGDVISPMIQMIMKLPGMGSITSFFEALAALFMPGPDLMTSLGGLATHAQDAVVSLSTAIGEHTPVSLSLLPANAPIFQTLGSTGHGFAGLDLAAGKIGPSLGEHGAAFSRDSLNVSGQLDPTKSQFEMSSKAGTLGKIAPGSGNELVSGPAMNDGLTQSHLAPANRLFSDKIGGGVFRSQVATGSALPTSQTVPVSGSWNNGMQVGATPFAQEAGSLPAVANVQDGIVSGPSMSQNIGQHFGGAARPSFDGQGNLGPSGAVTDKLGGRELLASNDVPTYRPTIGSSSMDKAVSSGSAESLMGKGVKDAPMGVTGLKAKALTLPGVKVKPLTAGTPAVKPVSASHAATKQSFDQIAHQSRAGSDQVASHSGGAVDQISHKSAHHSGDHRFTPKSAPSEPLKAEQSLHRQPDTASAQPEQVAQATPGADSVTAGSDAVASDYTIKSGDNLWNIAKEKLGEGSRWHEIYKLNQDTLGANPDLIHTGVEIKLPGADLQIAQAGSDAGTYTVHSGDNLWNIARDHMGGGEHWGEIYKANADVVGSDPRLILPGQQLTIPGAAGTQVAAAPTAASPDLASAATGTPAPAVAHEVQPVAMESAPASPQFSQAAPVAQPVLPSTTVDPSVPASGAASASPINLSALPASPLSKPTIVSASLKPDLSFLSNLKVGKGH